MMRLTNILLFSLCCVPYAGGLSYANAADSDVAATAVLAKAGFVKEHAISGVKKIIGWNGDHFFAAKQDGSVDELDSGGRKILAFQARDSAGAAVLKQAEAAAVAEGIIYVADSDSNLVAMFTTEGKYQGSFGGKKGGFFGGKAGVELSSPHGIAIHEGLVYVADTGNGKIQIFGLNGVFLATLEIEGSPENKEAKEKSLPYKLGEPTDIAINALGQIYVLDANDSLIKVYSPDGKYIKHLPKEGKPLAFSLGREGSTLQTKIPCSYIATISTTSWPTPSAPGVRDVACSKASAG